MPRFAANLTMMFPEFDLKDRFSKARDLGFSAVELLQPYTESTADIKKWLSNNQLEIILINTPMGQVKRGERGLACLPGREDDFKEAFPNQFIDVAIEEKHRMTIAAGIAIEVKKPEEYKEYIEKVKPVAEKFGGDYIIRGGETKVVEGEWTYPRTVVIKFPSYEKALEWYNSEEYKPIKQIRLDNSVANGIIIKGA